MLLLILAIAALSGFASAGLISLVSKIFTEVDELSRDELLMSAILLGAVALAVLGLEVLVKFLLLKHAAERHRDLQIGLLHRVLNNSLRNTETTGMARLITIYSDDMSQIGTALVSFSSVGVGAFVIVGCLAYLCWIAPGVVMVMVLLALPASWVYRRLHAHAVVMAKQAFEYRDTHVAHFKKIVHGIKELKLSYSKRSGLVENEYLPAVTAYKEEFVRSMVHFAFAKAWTQLIYFALMIAALLYIILSSTEPDILGPFLIVALFMRSYIGGLLSSVPAWARAGVILRRLEAEGYTSLATIPGLDQPGIDLANGADTLEIEISDLSYSYRNEMNDEVFTVGPVSLTLGAGELIFVVGHNGAGKTTFAKLISGLYENEAGTLCCNGVQINDGNRNSYRELFSAIFADPFVFEQLNVADTSLDEPEINSRIMHYLEKLRLQYKVRVENQRLESVDLSHGQRKRLALLAAYLEDKPVLIFDEWAENQDPVFKEVFD